LGHPDATAIVKPPREEHLADPAWQNRSLRWVLSVLTVVELRRLVQQYPNAPRLDSLRAEIDELKAGLFDEPRA
jgi:hypothetical protein